MIAETRERAFTLFELLAVLVVLSAAAALAIGALGRASDAHRRRLAVETLHQALERARLLADGRGGATLTLGPTLIARPNSSPAGLRYIEFARPLPHGWSSELRRNTVGQDQLDVIPFGPDGTCADHEIGLTSTNSESILIRLLGLTGVAIELTGRPGGVR